MFYKVSYNQGFVLCWAWGGSEKSHNIRLIELGIVTLFFVICVYSKIITKS